MPVPRNQAAHDHVFLQAAQVVHRSLNGGFVSTRVVSWNDAADMNESVESDAFVMPSSNGRPVAGLPPSRMDPFVFLAESELVDLAVRAGTPCRPRPRPSPSASSADDHLDMLIRDVHALEPVDFWISFTR